MKKLLITTILITTLAACQKSEEPTLNAGGLSEVVFTSAISTRVTGTQWDNGDKIGVFMYATEDTEEYSSNVLYTASDAENGTFTATDPIFYPEGAKVDFVAYHPYTTNYNKSLISLNTADQSTEEKIKAQDFMVASAQSCDKENAPSLNFTRKMSKIVISVNRIDTKEDATLSDILLSDVIVDGSFMLVNAPIYRENAIINEGSTTSSISLFFNETSSVIEAIIIPQEASATLEIMVDGKRYITTISGTFNENTLYNYNLSIGVDIVKFTQGTISEWTEKESGDMGTEQTTTSPASQIDANNIPESDIWFITDEGEITKDLMSGVKLALDSATDQNRTIRIILSNATSIGDEAFGNWENLSFIELPQVTSIGVYAFHHCSSLTSFDFEGVTSIGEAAFSNCSSLAEVTNFKIESIPDDAFNQSALTSFDFEWVTSIGEAAFINCSSLAEVTNFKIESIPAHAFRSTALTSFDFEGVTSIGEAAFRECLSLAEVTNIEVDSIPSGAFYSTALTSFDFTGVTSIGESAFRECLSLAEVTNIEVDSIPTNAFNGTALTSFDFEGITSIGVNAFAFCSSLAEVTNFKIESIPTGAFSGTALTSFDFTEVTSIGMSAFSYCTSLTDIELPSTITSISDYAFWNSNITTVTLNWDSSDNILDYDSTWFKNTPISIIYIPSGTTSLYEDKNWSGEFTLKEKSVE